MQREFESVRQMNEHVAIAIFSASDLFRKLAFHAGDGIQDVFASTERIRAKVWTTAIRFPKFLTSQSNSIRLPRGSSSARSGGASAKPSSNFSSSTSAKAAAMCSQRDPESVQL